MNDKDNNELMDRLMFKVGDALGDATPSETLMVCLAMAGLALKSMSPKMRKQSFEIVEEFIEVIRAG